MSNKNGRTPHCSLTSEQSLNFRVSPSFRQITRPDLLTQQFSDGLDGRTGSKPLQPSTAGLSCSSAHCRKVVGPASAEARANSERVVTATLIGIEIVRKFADQTAFVVHPRRWAVERTFAWLNRNRHLSKDFEHTIRFAAAFLYAAPAMLLVRRLASCAWDSRQAFR